MKLYIVTIVLSLPPCCVEDDVNADPVVEAHDAHGPHACPLGYSGQVPRYGDRRDPSPRFWILDGLEGIPQAPGRVSVPKLGKGLCYPLPDASVSRVQIVLRLLRSQVRNPRVAPVRDSVA